MLNFWSLGGSAGRAGGAIFCDWNPALAVGVEVRAAANSESVALEKGPKLIPINSN